MYRTMNLGRFYCNGTEGGTEGGGNNPPPKETPPPRVFTQDEVNAFLAKEKKTLREELEKIKKAGDPAALQGKIKELSDAMLTKEELARQEQETLKTTYEGQVKTLAEEAGTWQNRYKASVFQSELTRAASKHDAFDPDQLAVLLRDSTTVSEDTDKDGKGTGKFAVKTKIVLDGKELVLPIDEAVGKLRESGKYPNQFKVKGSPGTGLTLNNNPERPQSDGSVPATMGDFMKLYQAGRKAGSF